MFMKLFRKKSNETNKNASITGFTKSRKFLFFKIRSKPIYSNEQPQAAQQAAQQAQPGQHMYAPEITANPAARPAEGRGAEHGEIPEYSAIPKAAFGHKEPQPKSAGQAEQRFKKPGMIQIYIAKELEKHKGLDDALIESGMKISPYDFVKKMLINSIIVAAVLAVAVAALLIRFGNVIAGIVIGIAFGYALRIAFFQKFITYPLEKVKAEGKEIEKDILFATRDIVIGMRSGVPLFNAITSVSTGYGAASDEFKKIVDLVELGTPISDAIDRVSAQSKSKTFKRIMLQASVSIKAGADIVGALQEVVDEVMQERVIELRRYGQRLNALAMFYMLFGVIFPSMGIAVAAIITTFINIITVTPTTLLMMIVGMLFVQILFLNILRSSRPSFAM